MRVWASPPEAKGRALGVRVKRGRYDVCAISLYFPPRPSRLSQRPRYLKTVSLLISWLEDVFGTLPV
eukprot:1264898-Pyramimonas_sp.AAC.1